MPQPADYLGAFVILGMVAILCCGVAGICIAIAIDALRVKIKRAQLRRARHIGGK